MSDAVKLAREWLVQNECENVNPLTFGEGISLLNESNIQLLARAVIDQDEQLRNAEIVLQQQMRIRDEEIDALRTRRDELLATIVRLTNETPYPDEVKSALEQRGKLLAEIGTLRTMCESQANYIRDLLDHKEANLREIAALKAALREALDAIDGGREPIAMFDARIAELRRLV